MAKQNLMKRIAIGAAIAGAAGYIAGLLTAPKSGKETREDIGRAANKGMDDVEKQLKQLQTELGDLVDEARHNPRELNSKAQKELKDLLGKAKDSKDKMREVISAVHDGEANDKYLNRAITDAKRAIEHIKDFIEK